MIKNKIRVIDKDIVKNITFRSEITYVVDEEVHVKKGIKLTIQDLTTILIRNGVKPNSKIKRAALIFDQGSSLSAKRFYVRAANLQNKPVKFQDNGGIWFLGNYQDSLKDAVSVRVNRKNPLSNFSAAMIAAYYLGRHDEYLSPKTGKKVGIGDDIDGISILGVGNTEWSVSNIRSHYSADDGLDITNSHIKLDRLEIKNPVEDGLNLSSSRVEVHKSLKIDVTKNKVRDRDIFDFEVDDGASYLEIHQNCAIDIKGIFGDELVLSSIDMAPAKYASSRSYKYNGISKKRSTLIYSIKMD